MKKLKICLAIAICMGIITNSNMVSYAATPEKSIDESNLKCFVDIEDDMLEEAEIISEETRLDGDRLIIEKVYRQSDGTLITDTLNVSAVAQYSKNGSDTTTRTRNISNWGTITITASFDWYTQGMFSYVKCTSMSASHALDSKAVVSKWETSCTDKYVSIGKAKAQVEYYFYNSEVPYQYQDGTFKITCSDSGTISDNN